MQDVAEAVSQRLYRSVRAIASGVRCYRTEIPRDGRQGGVSVSGTNWDLGAHACAFRRSRRTWASAL